MTKNAETPISPISKSQYIARITQIPRKQASLELVRPQLPSRLKEGHGRSREGQSRSTYYISRGYHKDEKIHVKKE